VRLCKHDAYRYQRTTTSADLKQARESADARFRMIATDGVFSMDGFIANLGGICDLADKYDALVMVDDSHRGIHGAHGPGHSRALRVWAASTSSPAH